MAEKKSKVKAHRGFIHIPKRRGPRRPPRFPGLGGPRRPIRRNPVNLKNLGYIGRLPKGMQDLLLRGRRRPPRIPFDFRPQPYPLPIVRRAPQTPINNATITQINANLKQLRETARGRGLSIPRFPTGTPPPSIRRNPQKMKEFRRKQLISQLRRTQNFIDRSSRPRKTDIEKARKLFLADLEKARKQQQSARMGSRRQTAAPVQQAVRNPNTRRRIPNRLRTRVRTMVAKGGTAKKKK